MAGFDLAKQHSYVLPGGGRGEAGRIDFSATSFCQALPTRLVSIYAWNASPAIDVSIAVLSETRLSTDLNIYENGLTVDIGDITNSNIIVHRQTQRNDISASWYYELKGW